MLFLLLDQGLVLLGVELLEQGEEVLVGAVDAQTLLCGLLGLLDLAQLLERLGLPIVQLQQYRLRPLIAATLPPIPLLLPHTHKTHVEVVDPVYSLIRRLNRLRKTPNLIQTQRLIGRRVLVPIDPN